jgi:hypothetical protein
VKHDRQKTKPAKVTIPFKVTEAFRDALHRKAREESRDASKVIRLALRKLYPDLPEE